ncbi:cobalamin-binding protein [candidate division KSB1 bacterium]|nr:cobalamin-binding protein [candidate division KSB1 bacterium]
MKIVSLLPSATEIVYALGLGEQLLAVTHECDYPSGATEKPVITSSVLEHSHSSSLQIHKGITGLVHEGKSIYHLNEKLLAEIKPDLILTQELCDVCAVSYNIVFEAAKILEGEEEIISLEPHFFRDILSNILLVGEKTGKNQQAKQLIESFEQRIAFVEDKTSKLTAPRKVYCMEWIDPPFAAGHWISEMVSIAGGREELAVKGKPSVQIEWQDVVDYAPEILVFMPCGFGLEKSIAEAKQVQSWPGWSDLPAVQKDQVYAVDGSSFFNRPGPRLVDGLEILAQILNPEIFSSISQQQNYQKIPFA